MRQIQRRGLNIITVEDPVEYRIPGIVQVQINDKAGLTFASALRSILRQDPDAVLIGEIRDRETAAIAIQASLTGHLVFATLHTNDACSSITRLTDLGVDSSKLSAALKGVIAQRLIRKLCPECRIVANAGAPVQLRPSVAEDALVHTSTGCPLCAMSGYSGRVAVTEIVIVDADLERAIADRASVEILTTTARRGGARSLWESGVASLLRGETGGDELLRVLEQQVRLTDAPAESTVDDVWSLFDTRSTTSAMYHSHDDSTSLPPTVPLHDSRMTGIKAGVVDVYVIRPLPGGWKVLAVKRAIDTRCPNAWETIHGGSRPASGPRTVRSVR